MLRALVLGLAVSASLASADGELDDIRKEPDLLRRSERALDFAERTLRDAQELAKSGESAKVPDILEQVSEACDLSLQALRDTGKRPGKLVKYYKKGEQRMHEIVRRLESLVPALNYEDRPRAEPLRKRIVATHEGFLLGVMSK